MLPAQTYVKGFLRTYAEYLGLDGQLYVDEFNSRFVSGEEYEPGSGGRPRDDRSAVIVGSRRTWSFFALGVIAILTVIVISAWKAASGSSPAAPRYGRHRRSCIGRRSSHRSSR